MNRIPIHQNPTRSNVRERVDNNMPLTDLKLRPVHNHGNCPDLLAGLYEPLLAQAVRYDRTTYTFTTKGADCGGGRHRRPHSQRRAYPPHLRPQRPRRRATGHPRRPAGC